jgi:hypothetical protein
MDLERFGLALKSLALVLPKWAPDFSKPNAIGIWFTSFKEMPQEKFLLGCKLAKESLEEFPSLKKLMELCEGNILDPEELGQQIAAKIEEAMEKIGGYNPQYAQNFLGPLGWKIVQENGGWNAICNLTYKDLEHLRKKWRDRAKILHKNMRHLGHDLPPNLPEGPSGLKRLT